MKPVSLMRILTASVGWSLSVHAAQITNESFTAGSNGWVGLVGGLNPSAEWQFTGQVARLEIFEGPAEFSTTATLKDSPSASGGAFTGNYDAASVALIGFRILSDNPNIDTNLPLSNVDTVLLSWLGGTSRYFRAFSIPQSETGLWHNFAVSLDSYELGGWTVASGSKSNFPVARQSVSNLIFSFSRRGALAQTYLVDDIFIDRLPAATAMEAGGSTGLVTWSYLRSNTAYRVERADQSTNLVWSTLETLTATGTTHVSSDPALDTNLFRVYRMVIQ